MMGGKYFVVGTFFKIQLRIDYSWFIIFGLIAWSVMTSYLPSYKHGLSTIWIVIAGLIVTIIFFVSVIAHEYAHSIVANKHGLKIKRITLFLFGGASELQNEPKNAKTELLMTVAGPLTSLIIAGIFAILWLIGSSSHITAIEIVCGPVAVLNFVVALFNLVPAFPLDGGRILRSIIWMIKKDRILSTRYASNTGIILSYLIISFGVLSVLTGGIVGGLWLAVIGFFLLQSAKFSYSQLVAQQILENIKVKAIYNNQFDTVPIYTTLESFLDDYALRLRQYDFIAVDSDGEPVGIIELSKVRRLGSQHYNERIGNYIQPLSKDLTLKQNDRAIKALQIMQRNNLALLPVLSNKQLVGVVTRQYLEDYVAIHQPR